MPMLVLIVVAGVLIAFELAAAAAAPDTRDGRDWRARPLSGAGGTR